MDWVLHLFDPATWWTVLAQFQSDVRDPAFWLAVGKIVWINVLLSGDNALVIALACRGLQPRHRLWGTILGAGAAVLLRVIFTGIVATLLEWPYLKLIGGLALLLIAAKLLVPDDEDEDSIKTSAHLWSAIRIIVAADLIMSLDNVIAVAAAANGSVPLLILGLLMSVPMIVAGAGLIMLILDRLPILVWVGAALLGWVAGDVIATDPAVHPLMTAFDGSLGGLLDRLGAAIGMAPHFTASGSAGESLFALIGLILVLIAGAVWRRIQQSGMVSPGAEHGG